MVRGGFDLSGDLRIEHDPIYESIFPLVSLRQVGMRPKLYARVARFEAALDSKARSSNKSWTNMAHEFGYYDQMHMVHDFADFAGGNSNEYAKPDEKAFSGTD